MQLVEIVESPRISVVVTAYGRPDGLVRTLESLVGQSRQADEVLVYDDASPIDPTEIVLPFADCLKGFRFKRQPENLGMPGNLNEAIEAADGDIIINLHDADVYSEDLIRLCEEAFKRFPKAGLVFWSTTGMPKDHTNIDEVTRGQEFFKKHYLSATSSKIWGTVGMRREVYDALLPFDYQFGGWADVDMWMRVCGLCDIAYIAKPLVALDQTGEFRGFDWSKPLRFQQILTLNTIRIYGDDTEVLDCALRRQSQQLRKRWIKMMLSRALRLDFWHVLKGCAYLPKYCMYEAKCLRICSEK